MKIKIVCSVNRFACVSTASDILNQCITSKNVINLNVFTDLLCILTTTLNKK